MFPKIVLYSFQIVTLHFSLMVLRFVYYSRSKTKLVIGIIFSLYGLYVAVLLARLSFAYYCLRKDQADLLLEWDFYIYIFTVVSFEKKKLIIISIVGLVVHCVNVMFFIFFRLLRSFHVELGDLYRVNMLCKKHKVSIIDCLFEIRSWTVVKHKLEILSKRYYLVTNPFMREPDYCRLSKLYMLTELSFVVTTSMLGLCLLTISPMLSVHYHTTTEVELWTRRAIMGFIDIMFGLIGLSFAGVWAPLALIHMMYILLCSICLPWNRFSRGIIQSWGKQKVPMPLLKTLGLVFKLRFGQRLFLYLLKESIQFNNKGIGQVFAISVGCNLLSNAVFIIELFIGQLDFVFRVWLNVIILFQLCVILVIIITLINTSERLYRPSYHYVLFHVLISKQKCHIFFQRFLSLSIFLETMWPKKKFCFTMGQISRISRRTFYGFLPIYSSLIMSLLPLILKYKTSRLQGFI